jgi:putative hydrolase of the HAD superfamily
MTAPRMTAGTPPTAVVFDFGRVVFDWQPEALLQRVLPARVDSPETAAHWVGQVFQAYQGDWGDFDRGVVEVPALVARIARRTGLSEAEVQAVVDAVPHALQPLPGTVALLARLREAGRRLFFLSNMPAPYADHLERTHPFMAWFEAGVFSSRAQVNKPDAGIYAHALARFGVPAGELLFIDDHAPNVEAARALGWQAVQFADAATLERDLVALGLIA